MPAQLPHGGRLQAARRQHPAAPEPWIDLSTGINPRAYPFDPPAPECWRRLPEPEDVAALEAAAARAYGTADPACVVAAPGTQALIQLLPRLLPQRAIAIAGPTYAGHEAAWRAAGAAIATEARAAVLCNPNNPDGARHGPAALLRRLALLDLLIVDEAYADFEPGLSLAAAVPRPGLVVLRSFGKCYGLAGVRLGFALTTPAWARRMRDALGPWAISGPALAIGRQALADPVWRTAAAEAAHVAAARLDATLTAAGLRVRGGTALFRLAEARGPGLADHLGRCGILVRSFADHPTWFRFGLPPDAAAVCRLAAGLRAWAG